MGKRRNRDKKTIAREWHEQRKLEGPSGRRGVVNGNQEKRGREEAGLNRLGHDLGIPPHSRSLEGR